MAAAETTEDQTGPRTVLLMTAICMVVVGFNSTAVATILPNLKDQLDLRPTELQWTMAIYTVFGATFVTILSRLGDITGKMGVFFFGMVTFAVGSITCLLAQDAVMLLTGRALQGTGAAALFGTSLPLLTSATPEEKRSGIVGIWGAIVGLAIGVGPIVGGAFAEYLNWRGIFAVDVVLLAVAFWVGLRVVKRKFVPDTRMTGARFHFQGAIAIVLLLGPLAFALSSGESNGWTSPWTVGPLVVSAVALVALFITARHNDDPLIELRYFKHPRFVMAGVGMFVAGFALFGFFVFFNVFVQSPDVFGYSAVAAGLAVLPLSLGMFVTSVTIPRFLAPYNFRWPIVISMAAMTLGFYLLSRTSSAMSYGEIWWKVAIAGIGVGTIFSLMPRMGLRLLPDKHAGQGSGVINTCLYFGATLGAVMCGIASAVTTRLGLNEVISALPQGSTQRTDLAHDLAHGSPGEVQATLAELSPEHSATLAAAMRDLLDDGFDSAMLVCAGASLIGLILALWLLRGPLPPLRDAMRFAPPR